MPLDRFSAPTRAWFEAAFETPTPAQVGAWEAIGHGRHALVVAPTGSGKTLSAFLWALDRLLTTPTPPKEQRTRVLYLSPLKALGTDVERNLRSPLAGIRRTAERLGTSVSEVTVGIRSGDTAANDRRRLIATPPDILITTPESLFLMLTGQARETLRYVETVIVDEIHAVAGTKRGAHLALTLERLDALLPQPAQRIGLSATVRPLDEVARFLGGAAPVEIVAPPSAKAWDLTVVVPVEQMNAPADDAEYDDQDPNRSSSIWPHVEEQVAALIAEHRSTIVFANSRRLAERLTSRLNEIASGVEADGSVPAQIMAESGVAHGALPVIARAHHGSVSKEERAQIEDDLKSGRLPAVVATSSLELGIDMGAVDLVIQIEAPPSIASALQRIGRAGHQVGETSHGVLFPKHRGDLIPTAVTVQRMREGAIESLSVPANPLDVLAQQIVAMTALDDWDVDELFGAVTRAAPYARLPRSAFDATLDLLSGRYPSEEFAELRPRVVWDRATNTLVGRPGSQRLAVTSGGTIPDRGLFAVYLAGEGRGRRVGELDEEMVYESRVGDVFSLGATSWRIQEITHDRVLVTPAPGVPGRLPFWKGDTLGRPVELGEAIGSYSRTLATLPTGAAIERAREDGLDEYAATNLVAYLTEQSEATRVVPSDTTILLERFRDELGDWRLVLHSPYGTPVHEPWALAIEARLRERYGLGSGGGLAVASDDGVVIRIPDTDSDAPPGAELVLFEPDEIEAIVTEEITGSALFASRFRECAARALLLPRRDPGRRSPLWQQRQRSASLLAVAGKYPTFPIVLEAVRECLRDVYDLPALVQLLSRIQRREITLTEVATTAPSPYARALLFRYVGQFMYEGDAPVAERRAAALTLDQGLLAELLGRAELRELLDPQVLEELELELQRLAPECQVRNAEQLADMIRLIGPLSLPEIVARSDGDAPTWLATLTDARRVVEVRVAGEPRWAVVEDAGRLRDALGTPVPAGTPAVFLEAVEDPFGDLVARHARCHGPFTADEVATRLGVGVAVARHTLTRLAAAGRLLEGEFRPAGTATEWCDAEVLRTLRRRSLTLLRHEVEPVEPAALGRFLPTWQHVAGSKLRGVDGVLSAIEQLAGCPLPASAIESLVLPSRVADYSPTYLDELTTAGEVLWAGHGALGSADGWVSLHLADTAALTLPVPSPVETDLAQGILDALAPGGAWFFRNLAETLSHPEDHALADALWELVWAGHLGNDSLAPLRALTSSGRTTHRTPRTPPRARALGRRARPSPRFSLPQAAGRWALLPRIDTDPTRRAHDLADQLLERHGIVTRGAVAAENAPGGFAHVYKVLTAFEDSGRCRRGYFVEGLGAAQFALPGAVDRLRSTTESGAVSLAATDPANPYGAALPWPQQDAVGGGHRPGRKAGAIVILVDGDLALYVEKGGRTLLSWSTAPDVLAAATTELAALARRGALGRVTLEKADGEALLGAATPLRSALEDAGFSTMPRGMRLRDG